MYLQSCHSRDVFSILPLGKNISMLWVLQLHLVTPPLVLWQDASVVVITETEILSASTVGTVTVKINNSTFVSEWDVQQCKSSPWKQKILQEKTTKHSCPISNRKITLSKTKCKAQHPIKTKEEVASQIHIDEDLTRYKGTLC